MVIGQRLHSNKTRVRLENMPGGWLPSTSWHLPRADVLKALGDETRYAMYRELATSTAPLSAQELADRLGLHANTVRLHLDRLRDAGLVDVEAMHRGTVGRPQHLYFLAAGRARPRVRPARARAARRAARRAGRARRRRRRTTPPTPASSGAPRPAAAPAPGAASRRSTASSTGSASSPRSTPPTAPSEGADPHRVPALPVPRARRGLPRAGVQPAPRVCARASSTGRRGKSRGVRDVVRPGAVPCDGCGRVP